MARIVRPMLLMRPPRLARRREGLIDLYRMMTMSVGDLLDEWFDDDAVKGAYASTGVVGVWAGPRTPGTAYNLLHHALGELERSARRVGPREGRHGCDLGGARAERREPGRDDPHGRRGAIDRCSRRHA